MKKLTGTILFVLVCAGVYGQSNSLVSSGLYPAIEDARPVVMAADTGYIYAPIARDRDQAFSKTDGISLHFLSRRWALRPLQNMDAHVKDIRGANFAARNLDRQFLNGVSKDEWKKHIAFVQSHLTDSAIKNAVNTMPPEVNKISGDFLVKPLIQRRIIFYGMVCVSTKLRAGG